MERLNEALGKEGLEGVTQKNYKKDQILRKCSANLTKDKLFSLTKQYMQGFPAILKGTRTRQFEQN